MAASRGHVENVYAESAPGRGDAPRRARRGFWSRLPTPEIAIVLWVMAIFTAIPGVAADVPLLILISLLLMIGAGALFFVPSSSMSHKERLHRERMREGRCVSCGYSLRGLAYGARSRCPECGSKAG